MRGEGRRGKRGREKERRREKAERKGEGGERITYSHYLGFLSAAESPYKFLNYEQQYGIETPPRINK